MLWRQTAEEGSREDLEFSSEFRTISHTLPSWPTDGHNGVIKYFISFKMKSNMLSENVLQTPYLLKRDVSDRTFIKGPVMNWGPKQKNWFQQSIKKKVLSLNFIDEDYDEK